MRTRIKSQRQALLAHLEGLRHQPFQSHAAILKLATHIVDEKMDSEIDKHPEMETPTLANMLLALEEINK